MVCKTKLTLAALLNTTALLAQNGTNFKVFNNLTLWTIIKQNIGWSTRVILILKYESKTCLKEL